MTAPKRQTYLPTQEEHEQIEKAILSGLRDWFYRHRDWTIFKTASMTGMRLSEVLNLNIKWIDWNNNTITIPAELNKNRIQSTIWMCPALQVILKNYIKTESDNILKGYLFCSKNSRTIPEQPQISSIYWQYAWKEYLTMAGLYEHTFINKSGKPMQKIRFHTATRTYFINRLFKSNPGVNLADLSRITRHRSMQCLYDYYLRFNDLKLWQDCLTRTFE